MAGHFRNVFRPAVKFCFPGESLVISEASSLETSSETSSRGGNCAQHTSRGPKQHGCPLRVVQLGRSTCHAISGRGG